ncbi:SIS domain-containing protein [Amycolatopsis jiangsuensis]|uniref:Glutamine--fructose-6-phosphate aminotransferase [isomerizing] n=1 Tax=Amycolatopsis jiangsuensis TaxID=1181879 RepID=A0A840J110_9PSEU|nr:SIS domain-containing protein [Amycolatopsis jiangsuensis]MBB4688781.1 glucosamine--fructose-6-phosphate aminotransferase (isomerizing) [Amycolatopsis jiangsuensis]
MKPEVLVRQADRLGDDLRARAGESIARATELTAAGAFAGIGRVVLVGNGDSHHAAHAAALAFVKFAGVACEPLPAQRFADYPGPGMGRGTLVVGISASGGSPMVVEAIRRARELGAVTVAVTGRPGSALTDAAEHPFVATLPGLEPSPGVRTHQLSLLLLLALAIGIGTRRAVLSTVEQQRLAGELGALADLVEETAALARPVCARIAAEVANAPLRIFLGTGPSHGSALHAAAKIVESAGLPSLGQDTEEWWHVERFCRPADLPVFVLAQPGTAHRRAVALAARARQRGRRLRFVGEAGEYGAPDVPIAGPVRAEFAPLVYGVFAPYLAADVAAELGHEPFLADLSG